MSTILLAEDDPDIRHLVSTKLQRSGFDVIETMDGAEALDAARRAHPDLVLLDVRMPRLTGLEVLRELRADPRTARLPILILTARTRALDIELGYAAGATDYIIKPFSPRELVRRVEGALSRVGSPMTGAFSLTLEVLVAVVALIAGAIVVVRGVRGVRRRRAAELGSGPRRSLLAFVADNGEQGSEDLIAIPEDAWQAALPAAVGLLGKLRGEAHAGLVSVFLHRGAARAALRDLHARGGVRRARAAQLLGDLELAQAVPELCQLLTDRDHEVRVVAVRALGKIGEPSAAWRIIASLDQHHPVPSQLATHTLVQLGRDAEVVLSAALDHPQARVRAVCLDALGLLGATGAVHRMARVLREDTVPDVRAAAAVNLGRLGTRTAVKPLTEALDPARPPALRAAAARALGDLGAPSAVPALVAALDDGEFQVAHEAAHSLRRLGPAGLDALRDTRDAAVQATRPGQQPPASVSHCQEALAAAAVHEIGLAVAR